MKFLSFLQAVSEAVSIVLPETDVPSFVLPLAKHGIMLAEHAIGAKDKAPLTGEDKLQLATEAVGLGVDSFNAAIVAKGGTAADVDLVAVKAAIDKSVTVANALRAAADSIDTKVAQSSAVDLSPSLDAVAHAKVATATAQPRARLL